MVSAENDEPLIRQKTLLIEQMSVDELEHRILVLRHEIAVCEAEIERKRAQKQAAEALFGPGT